MRVSFIAQIGYSFTDSLHDFLVLRAYGQHQPIDALGPGPLEHLGGL